MKRIAAIAGIFGWLTGLSAAEPLLDQLRTAVSGADSALGQRILERALADDPAAFAGEAGKAELGAQRDVLLTRIAQQWAAKSPEAALAWASGLGDPALAGSVLLKWAESQPQLAVPVAIDSAALAEDRSDVLRNLVGLWVDRDLTAASDWILAQPRGAMRDEWIQLLAKKLAESIPVEGASLVLAQISPGQRQEEAVICVLHQWALRDLPAACIWAESLSPESPLGLRARREMENLGANR